VVTKAGIAVGTATNVAIVPELGLSVATFNAVNSAQVADSVAAMALELLVPAVRAALLASPCELPLPANAAGMVGTWAAGAITFIVSPKPGDSCHM